MALGAVAAMLAIVFAVGIVPAGTYAMQKATRLGNRALLELEREAAAGRVSGLGDIVVLGAEQREDTKIFVAPDGTQTPRLAQLDRFLSERTAALAGTGPAHVDVSRLDADFALTRWSLNARWLVMGRELAGGGTGFVLVNLFDEWLLMQRITWLFALFAALSVVVALAISFVVFFRFYRSVSELAAFLDRQDDPGRPLLDFDTPLPPALARIRQSVVTTLKRLAAAQKQRDDMWRSVQHSVRTMHAVFILGVDGVERDLGKGRIDATTAYARMKALADRLFDETTRTMKLQDIIATVGDEAASHDLGTALEALFPDDRCATTNAAGEPVALRLVRPVAAGLVVPLVPDLLSTIMDEMKSNARKYLLAEGAMEVTLRREGDHAVVEAVSAPTLGTTLEPGAMLGASGVRSREARDSGVSGTGQGLHGIALFMALMEGEAAFERRDDAFVVRLQWPLVQI